MCNHKHNVVCTHTYIHLKAPNPLCESVSLAVTNTIGLFVCVCVRENCLYVCDAKGRDRLWMCDCEAYFMCVREE